MDFAASRFGMMSKFAAPFKCNPGKICMRKLSEMAASPCISPSTSDSDAICSSNSRGVVARIIPDDPSFPDSHWQDYICSHNFSKRFTDTITGVFSSCANNDTRNSCNSQPNSPIRTSTLPCCAVNLRCQACCKDCICVY